MLILNFSTAADTAGIGILTKQAFDRHSQFRYRTVCGRTNYIGYPTDLPAVAGDRWWRKADVVHVNNSFRAVTNRPRKPMVIHHHGTTFRKHKARLLVEQKRFRAQAIASTLDLYLEAPGTMEWVGAPYNMEWLAGFRKPEDGPLRICHSPTNRVIKSTDPFLKAVERLGRETPVETVLIERKPWVECLRLKGTCDIYYDQVRLGYGSNAIEAWGMGIPVVAGAATATLDEMSRRFGSLPFVEASESTIYEALLKLADPAERKTWGLRGRAHVEQFHADSRVVPQLEAIYQKTLGEQ